MPKSSERQQHVLQEIVPIAEMKEDCLHLQNGKYIDLIQILTKDLLNISEDLLMQDNSRMQGLYKTYSDDMKLISMNFPKSTKNQQAYFQRLIAKERNPFFKREQQEQLEILQNLERNNVEREYYLMIFAPNLDDMREKQMMILRGLGPEQCRKMTLEKKKEIIFKLNNKNSRVFL